MHVYRHSGAIPAGAGVMMVALGMLTAIVGGAIYALLIFYIPFVYINVLLMLGLGAAIGGTVGSLARAGKIRNSSLTTILAFILALVGIYVEWATIHLPLSGYQLGILAYHPNVVLDLMIYLYQEGWWSFSDRAQQNLTGIPLAIIWVLEAGAIICTSVGVARSFVAHRTFCEGCNRWTDTDTGANYLLGTGSEPQIQGAAMGDLRGLNELERAAGYEDKVIRIDIDICPSCEQSNFVTIQAVTNKLDSKGNNKQVLQVIVRNLVIKQADVDFVRTCGQGVVELDPEG